jgi:hypothetical protein
MTRLLINKAFNYDVVVDNADMFYKVLRKCFGLRISNSIIEKTIGSIFTAGKNLETLEKTIAESKEGQKFILDYSSEAMEGMKDHELVLNYFFFIY